MSLLFIQCFNMLPSMFLTLILLLNFALREAKEVKYAPEVTLKSGKIRGLLSDLSTGGTVRKYLGVPFAKAQRFQAPTDPDSWTGVKDMFTIGKICPQQPHNLVKFSDMVEECLSLNVFLPNGTSGSSALPVMVWIHGGGFIFGSNKIYDGSYIASLGNVIVVAINYRLSTFGFLATGKDGLKGNYGMLDQVHALKWVQNNIKSFGGDPEDVTIFGESAGGASVGFLVLSPLAKGLFHKAILQSGDPDAVWAYRNYEEALYLAKIIANDSGCAVESLGHCLKDKSFKEILAVSKRVLDIGESVFRPVVDGQFLPGIPDALFGSGKFADVDIMIGFTDDEGTVITDAIPGMETNFHVKNGFPRSNLIKIINDKNIKFVRGQNPVINEAILYLYTDWNNVTSPYRNRRMFIDMTGDSMFIAPAVKSANAIANKTSKIFMYQLQHRFDTFFNLPIPSWVKAFHASDLVILFGLPFFEAGVKNSSVYTKDANFSRAMITMWTNFAKSGDPNRPEPIPLAWPKYDVNQQKFMALKPMYAVQEKPRSSHVAFWNEFVPAALKAMPKPTAAPKTTAKPCVDSNAVTLTSGLMMIINVVLASLFLRW